MASGDTREQNYLDIAANGSRADLPSETCCETRTQTLTRQVAERIITEEEVRAAADRVLQSEIDEIKNNPDVFDIVATKADLDAYDTSTITDKDIIRVLRDEDHNNASTYYRWDASDREFDYIGEVGDYYTKAQTDALLDTKADKATTYTKTEVDAALAGKQDTLTAGANITISDNVISATDTTYTAGNGLDLTGTEFSVDTNTIATQNDLTTGLATKQDTLTAGNNITISNDTISATDTTYTAGNGLTLTGTEFSADTTVLATQTDLSTKQDTLTAGSNITITNDTISATDTTYSDFTGTDGTTDGTQGLVPAPTTTDVDKFLKSDGTWEEVDSGPTVVQTTGASTTDVMSQKAVTDIIGNIETILQTLTIGAGV